MYAAFLNRCGSAVTGQVSIGQFPALSEGLVACGKHSSKIFRKKVDLLHN